MTKKKPRFGALLLLNMPRRSHKSSKPPERRSIVRDVKPLASVNTSCYGTFEEFCHRAKSLKSLSEWSSKVFQESGGTISPTRVGNCRGRQSWIHRTWNIVAQYRMNFVDFDKELGGLHNVLWRYYYWINKQTLSSCHSYQSWLNAGQWRATVSIQDILEITKLFTSFWTKWN